ncbi:DUF3592 domain-containing protein [Kitasatospora sp. NPDC097691]|uniref:DUF3592 domain-containing protein n=1 Tax=Kitasatospora sp. NPDC097691 TaxID=3157231 RepID=UPI00331EA45F
MSDSSSPAGPRPARMPELVLRGPRVQARLERRHVVVEQGGTTHRIPVEAVERVESRPGVVEVVLHSATAPGTVFAIGHRNRRAAEAFTRVLSDALPVADRAARPVDGAALVTTEHEERAPAGRLRLLLFSWPGLLGCVYLCGLLAIPFGPAGHRTGAAVRWLLSPLAIGAAYGAWDPMLRTLKGWVLLRRGITVVARVVGHETDDSGESTLHYATYEFVDATGRTRTHTEEDKEEYVLSDTVQISYDPDDPRLVRRRDRLGPRVLGAGAGLLLIALPLALLGLYLSVGSMWEVFTTTGAAPGER